MTAYLTYSSATAFALTERIKQLPQSALSTFICLWGASGAGKSTLAGELARLLPDCTIFPIDNYLSASLATDTYDHKPTDTNMPYIEGLDPQIWDQALLNDHLKQLSKQRTIDMPIFDHRERKRSGYKTVTPHKFIIVEGAYALDNAIAHTQSMAIILDCSFHDRFIRKLVRTACVTKRSDLNESIERYITRTEPSSAYYLHKYSLEADYVIHVEANPREEFQGFVDDTPHTPLLHAIKLTPNTESGEVHPEESFLLSPTEDKKLMKLTYFIDNKRVFDTTISDEARKLLAQHYDFN